MYSAFFITIFMALKALLTGGKSLPTRWRCRRCGEAVGLVWAMRYTCLSAGISSACLQEDWISLLVGFSDEEGRRGKGGEAALVASLQGERAVNPANKKKSLGGRYAYSYKRHLASTWAYWGGQAPDWQLIGGYISALWPCMVILSHTVPAILSTVLRMFPPIFRLLSQKPHVWLELSLIRQHSPNTSNIFSGFKRKILMEQWEIRITHVIKIDNRGSFLSQYSLICIHAEVLLWLVITSNSWRSLHDIYFIPCHLKHVYKD